MALLNMMEVLDPEEEFKRRKNTLLAECKPITFKQPKKKEEKGEKKKEDPKEYCPECGCKLANVEGCHTCYSCGFSVCG